MKRTNYSTGSPWEEKIAYSRAVRVGNVIEVSGTVASGADGVVGKGDAKKQTLFIFEKIQKTLQEAGADMKDVVRTRIFLTDIGDFEKVGEAHAHFFKGINPVTTALEVSKLVSDDFLVEIEVSAVVG